jgi:hypothetical protein
MNYDTNSGARDVYFIGNQSKASFETDTGDALFSLYQSGDRIFWINNTTVGGSDQGFQIMWWSSNYLHATGNHNFYIINSVNYASPGLSLDMDSDIDGSNHNIVYPYNSDFYSSNSTPEVRISSQATYTKAQINAGTWGTNCKAVDPLLNNATGNTWPGNMTLQSGSPLIDAGVFPLTTSASGSGTVLTVSRLSSDMDIRYMFRAGDSIQIEGAGTYTIASLDSATQMTLTTSASWSSGMGVWYPWQGAKLDIGA